MIWSPVANGLSLSALEMWLVDRVAFEVSYLRDLEAVESWNKNMMYGSLIQAGIEGYIKTRQPRGAAKFIQTEYEKQVAKYDDIDEISWWATLAQHQVTTFTDLYAADLDLFHVDKSECQHKIELILPSGRPIVLNGFIDGEGDGVIMENKCRGNGMKMTLLVRLIATFRSICTNFYTKLLMGPSQKGYGTSTFVDHAVSDTEDQDRKPRSPVLITVHGSQKPLTQIETITSSDTGCVQTLNDLKDSCTGVCIRCSKRS